MKKKGSYLKKFDYKNSTIKAFENRLQRLQDLGLKEHKYRIVDYMGLNLRTWKTQLSADDVVASVKKIRILERKINTTYFEMIDKILDSNDIKSIAWLLEKEQHNIFEAPEEVVNTQVIRVEAKPFELPENLKVIEVGKNGTS